MGPIFSVLWLLWGLEQIVHIEVPVIPKKRGVVEPTIFFDVLGVAATFQGPDCIIIFNELKGRNFPAIEVELFTPPKDGFREWMDIECGFGQDKGDEERIFINKDCAASTESFIDGDIVSSHSRKI